MTTPDSLAPTVKVFSSNSMQASMGDLLPQFERANGCKIDIQYDPAKLTLDRINNGETADLVVVNASTMDELARQGKIVAGNRRSLAIAGAGVAVLKGTSKPDIATTEAFKRALLNAKSIAYTGVGVSGIYFAGLIERLGIAKEVQAKARIRPGGLIGELVASGEAEIAIQQIPELMAVPGIDIVGPLPQELQISTLIEVSVFTDARQPQAAQALLEFLTTPAAARVFKAKGYGLPA